MRIVDVEEFTRLIEGRATGFAAPEGVASAVAGIVDAVRVRGDEALLEFTTRFDRVELVAGELAVTPAEMSAARDEVDPEFLAAIREAAGRIAAYHRRQIPSGYSFEDEGGNLLGQAVRPLERVGVYVPGGRASYPSSVLMVAVPARLAGVREIVMCTPPGPGGRVDPAVLAAAVEAGVDMVFRVGGAQAVAAMAYGTATVPRVDKIVGPGNIYVTEAKRAVFGVCDIDGLHGPSEVGIMADGGADPAWVAADLIAQAEHDPLAVCVLLTPDRSLAEAVGGELERQLAAAPRREVAAAALADHGLTVLTRDLDEAVELANLLAPEHLQVMVEEALPWLERVRNAGAVFLGYHAPVPAGDYAAGTNHVLPTGGTARFFSGLSLNDFVKTVGYFYGVPEGVRTWGPASVTMALREGLPGHAAAAAFRLGAEAPAVAGADGRGTVGTAGAAALKDDKQNPDD